MFQRLRDSGASSAEGAGAALRHPKCGWLIAVSCYPPIHKHGTSQGSWKTIFSFKKGPLVGATDTMSVDRMLFMSTPEPVGLVPSESGPVPH